MPKRCIEVKRMFFFGVFLLILFLFCFFVFPFLLFFKKFFIESFSLFQRIAGGFLKISFWDF